MLSPALSVFPYQNPNLEPASQVLRQTPIVNPNPEIDMIPETNHLHPRVEVDLDRLALVVHGQYPYEIDLERCTNAAHLLDIILQVSDKPWCDRALAGELLAAVETACEEHFRDNAQGVYCPGGHLMRVDWAEGSYAAVPAKANNE